MVKDSAGWQWEEVEPELWRLPSGVEFRGSRASLNRIFGPLNEEGE